MRARKVDSNQAAIVKALVADLVKEYPMIIAIDPGTYESGWISYRPAQPTGQIYEMGISENSLLLSKIANHTKSMPDSLAIEMIASYGMPVGKETFETCIWIGRFIQAWGGMQRCELHYRKDIKLHLCGTTKAKDANIRQALLDRFGGDNAHKKGNPLYGVKSHVWSALAVAVTAADKQLLESRIIPEQTSE